MDIDDGGGITIDKLRRRVKSEGALDPDDGMVNAGELISDDGAGGEGVVAPGARSASVIRRGLAQAPYLA